MEKIYSISEVFTKVINQFNLKNVNKVILISKGNQISIKDFINACLIGGSSREVSKILHKRRKAIIDIWNSLFSNISKKGSMNYRNFLLLDTNIKYCSSCKNYLSKDCFSVNNLALDKRNSTCKSCYLQYCRDNKQLINNKNNNYRANKLQRVPQWADLNKIKEIYLNCPEGYTIDHIIPLQGKLVSGLHVEANLQYLTKSDNSSKKNKYIPEIESY